MCTCVPNLCFRKYDDWKSSLLDPWHTLTDAVIYSLFSMIKLVMQGLTCTWSNLHILFRVTMSGYAIGLVITFITFFLLFKTQQLVNYYTHDFRCFHAFTVVCNIICHRSPWFFLFFCMAEFIMPKTMSQPMYRFRRSREQLYFTELHTDVFYKQLVVDNESVVMKMGLHHGTPDSLIFWANCAIFMLWE